MSHSGPAVVFHSYDEMRARIDDPDLEVTADSVLVLAGAGPVAVPGMPEWGMIPIPARLVDAGVRDMVRVTDARMSGTSFGTCVLHVAPEAVVGGPLALVRDGDVITLDVPAGSLDLDVDADELDRRAAEYVPPSTCAAGRRFIRSTSPRPTSAATSIFCERRRRKRTASYPRWWADRDRPGPRKPVGVGSVRRDQDLGRGVPCTSRHQQRGRLEGHHNKRRITCVTPSGCRQRR
jgi:hypothetical protein